MVNEGVNSTQILYLRMWIGTWKVLIVFVENVGLFVGFKLAFFSHFICTTITSKVPLGIELNEVATLMTLIAACKTHPNPHLRFCDIRIRWYNSTFLTRIQGLTRHVSKIVRAAGVWYIACQQNKILNGVHKELWIQYLKRYAELMFAIENMSSFTMHVS